MGDHYLKPKNPIERYESLRLRESLSKPSLYIFACKELSFILKNSYTKLPKISNRSFFRKPFSLSPSSLSKIQTQSAISAANSLLQSAEFSLPKQKRALAAAEHKHAVVASKRKSKGNHEGQGSTQLPHDVLVHIFSFLDLESLVYSSAVCRSWNTAATDNQLWKLWYVISLLNSDNSTKPNKKADEIHSLDNIEMDWRRAFKTAYQETYYRKFKSRRGYCLSCSSIVWLSSNKCSNKPNIRKDGRDHQIKPVSTQQIVEFILHGSLSSESSSDSESDDEDASVYKLWAYPRQFGL